MAERILLTKEQRANPAGLVIGRWTILGISSERLKSSGHIRWNARCQCGTERTVNSNEILKGTSMSCGCLQRERQSQKKRTHGGTNTPEFRVWTGIKTRCFNPNSIDADDYLNRGITMCTGWKNSFPSFLADMGERPTAKHTIDRIDNNGNYSCGHCPECVGNSWPMNCRWATQIQQQRNTQRARIITFNGLSLCLAEWGERTGIPCDRIQGRLNAGWDVERALTEPIHHRTPDFKSNHKSRRFVVTESQVATIKKQLDDGMTTRALAKIHGVSRGCIQGIKSGTRWKHVTY